MLKKILIFIFCLTLVFGIGATQILAQDCAEGETCLADPLGGVTPQTLIGRVIQYALGLVGSLSLLMFVYGGLTWMTAAGNQEKITKGKNILTWATIGIVIIFSSYTLLKTLFKGLGAIE